MWSRRTSVGIGQVGLGAAFWLVESDSIALRILGVALAARGVSQFVIAYRNHPDDREEGGEAEAAPASG